MKFQKCANKMAISTFCGQQTYDLNTINRTEEHSLRIDIILGNIDRNFAPDTASKAFSLTAHLQPLISTVYPAYNNKITTNSGPCNKIRDLHRHIRPH